MQAEVDGLQMEVKRKESNLDMISTEKERILSRLKTEEGITKYSFCLLFYYILPEDYSTCQECDSYSD